MVYLDYAATSPVYKEAADKIHELMLAGLGNPGGLHRAAAEARAILHDSRKKLAVLLNVQPRGLFFTSGGTESNNWAIKSSLEASGKKHIILSATEHKSVLEAARAMERRGYALSVIKPDREGLIPLSTIEAAVRADTGLISVQAVNNETGVMQDVEAISALAKSRGILYHCDAVQSFGHVAQPLHRADLISLSAHKLGGPVGVGLLVARQPLLPQPLIHGGGQELSLRSGTENVAGIAGFAMAAELALTERDVELQRLSLLSEAFIAMLRHVAPDMEINGEGAPRHPGIVNCCFPGISGEELTMRLELAGICVSPGAACAARDSAPSHVLMAMGLGEKRSRSSLRFSFGRNTTMAELEYTAAVIGKILGKEV